MGRQRQEHQVVGDAGADAGTGRRVPPVLHVPFLELPRGRAQDLSPRLVGGTGDQGHHVLELVAEAVGATGLVKRRPPPDPAGQDLVGQPAVHHHVQGGVGGLHLNGTQHPVPQRLHLGQRLPGPPGGGVGRGQLPHSFRRVRLPQDEDDLFRLAGGQGDRRHERGARVERRPGTAGQARAAESGRVGRRAVAAQELGPVGGGGVRPRPHGREGELAGEAARPGAAGQDGPGLHVALAHDLQWRVLSGGPEHPLGVEGRRESPGPVAGVAHAQADQLDRVVRRDQHQQVLLQSVTLAGVAGVALAVADGHGRAGPPRQGRRRPDLARLLVAQVDRLAGRVGHRVVRPGGQAVHLAVARPRIAQAGLRHQAAEAGVGEHVGPRGRRQSRHRVDGDQVLAAVRREPAQAVPEQEALGRRGRPGGLGWYGRGGRGQGRREDGFRWPLELLGQRAASAAEDDPGRGFQEDRVVGRNLARGQDEHPTRLVEQRAGGASLEVSLELLGSVTGALVQKDQVQVQATAAGVDVPLHELADQRLVAGGDDAGQHDRAVARDGVRPKPRLTLAVGGDGVRHPQRRASEDDGTRQSVEQGNIVRRQAQLL